MATDLEVARATLLEATLRHVPFDGWSKAAIAAGAADAGLDPGVAVRAFPGGPAEVIKYFNAKADRAMLAGLEAQDLAAMRTRDRVALGVRLRLEAVAAHREAVRRALVVLALPRNGPLALRCLHRTVDAIWRAAGDTATDYNYYSKRALLGAVYAATVLYWLGDRSDDFADTWSFLDRRIADVMKVAQGLARIMERLGELPDRLEILRRPALRRRAAAPGPRPRARH